MIAAAKAADNKLMMAYRCRYEPQQPARDRCKDVREGEFGDAPARWCSRDHGQGFNIGNPASGA